MFSDNDKISSRQIKRLLIFDLFGASSLLLPQQLAKAGGGAGLWGIAAGFCLAGLYVWLMLSCCGNISQDYLTYLQKKWGSSLACLYYALYALFSLCVCAWAAKLLSELMCATLLESQKFPQVLLLVIALAYYGGTAGLEARARIYEMLFWILAVPLAIMLLLCIRQVQPVQWFPMALRQSGHMAGFWASTLQCFSSFLPVTFLLFLVPHMQDKKKGCRAAVPAVLISGATLLIIYLVLLGIFGRKALAQEQYPVITLLGMVKIPGDFVKRLDTLMVGVWFFTLYALVAAMLYHAVAILRKAFEKRQRKTKRGERNRKAVCFLAASVMVYGLAYCFYRFPHAEVLAGRAFYFVAVPFVALLPLLSEMLNKIGKE